MEHVDERAVVVDAVVEVVVASTTHSTRGDRKTESGKIAPDFSDRTLCHQNRKRNTSLGLVPQGRGPHTGVLDVGRVRRQSSSPR
jgi:hypothetical protein